MMKMTNIIAAMIVLGVTISANAAEYQFVAGDNSKGTKLCLAAVTNDMLALKNQLGRTYERRRYSANAIMCNDLIIANFAKKYDALDTFAYLYRYTVLRNRKLRPKATITYLASHLRKLVPALSDNRKKVVVLIASN